MVGESPGRHIGGRWDSGLPYLQGHLKAHWAPMGESANPLQGVQLLLDHVDVAPLKVTTSVNHESVLHTGLTSVDHCSAMLIMHAPVSTPSARLVNNPQHKLSMVHSETLECASPGP